MILDKQLARSLRGLVQTLSQLATLAAEQTALKARWLSTPQRGGTVTQVKSLKSGRTLLTVERADGSREQFVVD